MIVKSAIFSTEDLAPLPLKWRDVIYNIDNPEHQVDMDEVKILVLEPRWFEQGVKLERRSTSGWRDLP